MTKIATLACAGSIFLAACQGVSAGTTSSAFAISATFLNPNFAPTASTAAAAPSPSQICVSEAFSQSANATVRVTCGGNQFVSIEPTPGKPFVGTNGAAFRFAFGPGIASQPQSISGNNTRSADNSDRSGNPNYSGNNSLLVANPYVGVGTVTSFRVINLMGNIDLFEFLVSF